MTIRYPVDYDPSEDNCLGYAATADEAYALLTDGLHDDDLPDVNPKIVARQAGRAPSKEDIERVYADEIAAGYASPMQAGNWWVALIETWTL